MLSESSPLHEQVSNAISDKIRSGEFPVGSRLPGEAELMRIFGVSRGTVRRSLRTLNEAGYAQTFHGKGTFVRAGRSIPSIGQALVGLGEALSYSEKNMKTHVISKSKVIATQVNNAPCELEADEEVLLLDRVRYLDEIPVARLRNWVRTKLTPGICNIDFESTSLFNALDVCSIRPVASGQRSFEAVTAPEDVAESLSLSSLAPLLFIRQVTFFDDGTPVEWSDVWMDSSQIAVMTILSR